MMKEIRMFLVLTSSTRLAILKTKNSIAETRGETLTSDRFGDDYIVKCLVLSIRVKSSSDRIS